MYAQSARGFEKKELPFVVKSDKIDKKGSNLRESSGLRKKKELFTKLNGERGRLTTPPAEAIDWENLTKPVRLWHNMANDALLGKHRTKEYKPCFDQVKLIWQNSFLSHGTYFNKKK